MKLIVGLGNPGKAYQNTRHNTGFMFVDKLAEDCNVKFKLDPALKCEITNTLINGEKIYIIKPQTYMNLSGESVWLVAKYYKIDVEDILVIHDDLDLDVGKIRLRCHGSSGGHKGLQNIMDNFQTQDIKRMKVGISKVRADQTIDYVLGTFSKEDAISIQENVDKIKNIVTDFCSLTFENLMSRYNN